MAKAEKLKPWQLKGLGTVQRTIAMCKADSRLLDIRKVEHHVHGKTVDLFGGDIIALYPNRIVLIQATDVAHQADHIRDALASEEVFHWVLGGGSFQVWAWRELATGWRPAVTGIGPSDFNLPVPIQTIYGVQP